MSPSSVPSDDLDRVVVGTAGLGVAYGLGGGPPSEREAAALLRSVVAAGLRTFDTAPAYGEAEYRLGRWLPASARIWTKVGVGPPAAAPSHEEVLASLAASLRRLRRPAVELLQWHNWAAATTGWPQFARAWEALAADERVAALGATTYGVEDACAAVKSGLFQVVQIEWNLFNQHVLAAVAPLAAQHGVSLAIRSVLLQGVLAAPPEALPSFLAGLTAPVAQLRALAAQLGYDPATLAIRAALDQPAARWVLVGLDRRAHLEHVRAALAADRLTAAGGELAELALPPSAPTDPRSWPASAASRARRGGAR